MQVAPLLRVVRRLQVPASPGVLHRGVDSAILFWLGLVDTPIDSPEPVDPIDSRRFWAESAVGSPARLRTYAERRPQAAGTVRVLDLEGESRAPGTHPGSRRLAARAHLNRRAAEDAPLVLLIHGYAVSSSLYEDHHARLLHRRGVHTARLDLPFHMRRRAVGTNSGDGFFSADLGRTRDTLRAAVEDAAAVVAWARREVTPRVAVVGFSLGGLVTSLLAATTELEAAMPVIPAADLPEIFLERAPRRSRRRLGLVDGSGGLWGDDTLAARTLLEASLAPVVPRNLVPATAPDRITIIAARHDQVVGGDSARRLADAWGSECWAYDHGHITIMTAPGLTRRMHDQLVRTAMRDRGEAEVTDSRAGPAVPLAG